MFERVELLRRAYTELCALHEDTDGATDKSRILSYALRFSGFDVAYLKLTDDASQNAYVDAALNLSMRSPLASHVGSREMGLYGLACRRRGPVCVGNYFGSAGFAHALDGLVAEEGLHSFAAIPIGGTDTIRGALMIASRRKAELPRISVDLLCQLSALLSESEAERSLSYRQRQILYLMASGIRAKEIGSILEISGHTVRFHISALMEKLGCASQAHVVSEALRRGCIM